MQYRDSAGAAASTLISFSDAIPAFLRIQRVGTTFSAYTSTDGVILTHSGPLSFSNALWPPMEPCRGANQVGTGLQGNTALCLGIFKIVDRGEMAVGKRGVGECPEMLGRL